MYKPNKQMRAMGQTAVTRTESVDLQTPSTKEEVRNTPTTTPQSAAEKPKKTHPKGHRVRNLEEDIWKVMDGQSFLHLTDSGNLGDVWVMPTGVEATTTMYANVTFDEVVFGPHIKYRSAITKMAVDDVLRMLHLNDNFQNNIQGGEPISFDDWIAEKTASYIKQHGVNDSTNRSILANYVIQEDREFNFAPNFLKNCAVFFRKTTYHSYKTKDEKAVKFINPSMVKCCATRGSFEYMIEARLFPIPDKWWDREPSAAPETQAM